MLIDFYDIDTNHQSQLNNSDLPTYKEGDPFIQYKTTKYPTGPTTKFLKLTPQETQDLFDEQLKEAKKLAALQVTHGLLSKKGQRETINQYEKFFFADNLVFSKREILSTTNQIQNTHSSKKNKNDEPAFTTDRIDENTRAISRSRIREITGYSYHTKLKHSPTPVYIEWQEIFSTAISNAQHDIYVLDGSRQMGKSLITAQLLIEFSFLPNFDILIASFETKSTQRILNYISKYTKNFEEGMFEMHKQDGYLENTFSGSKIYFSTLSEDGDKVRGLTLSLVVIDEAQLVDCETMESGVLPTLSTTGGACILLGTATQSTDSYMYDCIMRSKSDPTIYVQSVTLDHNPLVPEKTKASIRKRLDNPNSRARALREYYCKWGGNDEKIFYPTIIPFAEPDYNTICVVGIDPARKQDCSAFTVLECKEGRVRSILSSVVPDDHKSSWELQAKFFTTTHEAFLKKYHQVYYVLDVTGVGDGVFEIFKKAGMRNMTGVRYTSGDTYTLTKGEYVVGKSLLINRTIDLATEGKLEVVEFTSKKLLEELDYAKLSYTSTGKVSFESRHTDDSINSLLIANFIAIEKRLINRSVVDPTTDYMKSYGFIPAHTQTTCVW